MKEQNSITEYCKPITPNNTTARLPINGIGAVVDVTKSIIPRRTYAEILYDTQSGNIWAEEFVGTPGNSWVVNHNPEVIRVCWAQKPMTEQEIQDFVTYAVNGHQQDIEAKKEWDSVVTKTAQNPIAEYCQSKAANQHPAITTEPEI